MQILEDETERLPFRLADQKAPEGVEHLALTFGRRQIHPCIVAHSHAKSPDEQRQLCHQLLVAQGEQLSEDIFTNLPLVIAALVSK